MIFFEPSLSFLSVVYRVVVFHDQVGPVIMMIPVVLRILDSKRDI